MQTTFNFNLKAVLANLLCGFGAIIVFLVPTLVQAQNDTQNQLFKVTKKGNVEIHQDEVNITAAEIRIKKQNEELSLNEVYFDVTPVKKGQKPWDSLSEVVVWSGAVFVVKKELNNEKEWVAIKDKKGKITYRIKVFEGDYKIPKGKTYTLDAKFGTTKKAKVGSMWNISLPADGVKISSKTKPQRKIKEVKDIATIMVTEKFNLFEWEYQQRVQSFIDVIESKYSRAEWGADLLKGSIEEEPARILLQDARTLLDQSKRYFTDGKYKKAVKYADEAQGRILMIIAMSGL